ncbi:MAG TPA: ribosome maturation factor RimM [Gaiellaceae bacterium]|nr:ribosome maturation factor RimM [Gaiellaceae bacterium]
MARRSTSRSTEADVVVGVVRGPHGVRGEVRIEPTTDRPEERFRVGARLGTTEGTLVIAAVRGTADAPIVRFRGIDDRTAAERLRGTELRVPRSAARREGEYLWDELIGLEAWTPEGARLGEVTEVLRAGGADVLVVRDGARETLLPALESVVREVDVAHGRIVVAPQEEA